MLVVLLLRNLSNGRPAKCYQNRETPAADA